jgi:8-oxo-dGTP pyrophosphatase MutT (NUDIX family)
MKLAASSDMSLLLGILEAHLCADEKERNDVATIDGFVRTEKDIFGKGNVRGHITGSALILDHQGRLLLTFHHKLKRWLQLGGHSDLGERDPAQTAMREAQEESGLKDLVFHWKLGARPIDIDVHTIPARKSEAEHLHLDFRYVFCTHAPQEIVCSDESDALRWIELTEMEQYDFDPALKRAIDKTRQISA